jgi:beta-lactamase superfamily II metal-dependent hydrolase
MQLEILNVGHGFCAYVIADNGNLLLVDCGHLADPEFRPSTYLHNLGQQSTQRLFITNYDQDHISDLPNVRVAIPVGLLHRNNSINADQLRALKVQSGPLTDAMKNLLAMIEEYNLSESNAPDFPRVTWTTFSAVYYQDFQDTNNLSLVVFLDCGGVKFVIPGDLERAGWLHHLKNAEFRSWLSGVNIFVASHHGRESGYCGEVFDYCKPSVIVLSDSEVVHATQEMAATYGSHASGITFNGQQRRVLSTRSDGSILWSKL